MTTTEKEKLRNDIKELVSQIKDKPGFTINLAKRFKREPSGIASNWLSRFYSIPEDFLLEVKQMAEEAEKE